MGLLLSAPANRISDALNVARARDLLVTDLSTEELRELDAAVRARAVFTARGTNATFVSKLKEVIDAIAGGNMGRSEARVTLLETLRALGYTPEGGFPDAPGAVPPAMAGSLRDLSSFRRLDFMLRTQVQLTAGAGQMARGHTPERLDQFPAWELVRIIPRETPRGTPESGTMGWAQRFRHVGGEMLEGRIVALKGDPVWNDLGSSLIFGDALDTSHPPFAFNSGMGWLEVDRAEVQRLGVSGPGGETIDEFHKAEARPMTLRGALPMPRQSTEALAPEVRDAFVAATGATPSSTPGSVDFSDILADEIAAADADYSQRYGGQG